MKTATKRRAYYITGAKGAMVGRDIVVDNNGTPQWWRVESVARGDDGKLAAVVVRAGCAPMRLTGRTDAQFTRAIYKSRRWVV